MPEIKKKGHDVSVNIYSLKWTRTVICHHQCLQISMMANISGFSLSWICMAEYVMAFTSVPLKDNTEHDKKRLQQSSLFSFFCINTVLWTGLPVDALPKKILHPIFLKTTEHRSEKTLCTCNKFPLSPSKTIKRQWSIFYITVL